MLKKDGPAIIDAAIGKFQVIVDGLDKGIDLCDIKQRKNQLKINTLQNENDHLDVKVNEAKFFSDNLKDMLPSDPEELPYDPKNKKENE